MNTTIRHVKHMTLGMQLNKYRAFSESRLSDINSMIQIGSILSLDSQDFCNPQEFKDIINKNFDPEFVMEKDYKVIEIRKRLTITNILDNDENALSELYTTILVDDAPSFTECYNNNDFSKYIP